MDFNILTFNNGVGIVTDAVLLKQLISDHVSKNVNITFLCDKLEDFNYDIGIWIQNFDINLLNRHKKNIFFINEEWVSSYELDNLHNFDYVICKSQHAKKLLSQHSNVIYIPFLSPDYYQDIPRSNKYLHFVGRAIQKNTELVLNQSLPITLIDPYNRYQPPQNFTHINTYQSTDSISHLLNSHNIHICCSLYEGWGHYMFEALSTGNEIICSEIPVFKEQLDPDLVHFIPSTQKFDMNYKFDGDNINNTFLLRKSYYVDQNAFANLLYDFKPKNKNQERRNLYKYIINTSTTKLISFFKNI